MRVLVAITAPGASRIRRARSPDLPTRGPPKLTTASSHCDQTVNQPTRHNGVAISLVGTNRRRHHGKSPKLGRRVRICRRTAHRLAVRRICHRDANP